MSNRIINTIAISCVLFGSSAIADQKPITVEKITKEYQSYMVSYKTYPSARRSSLTNYLLTVFDEKSLAKNVENNDDGLNKS